MRFESPLKAAQYAREKGKEYDSPPGVAETIDRDSPAYKRIFEIQAEIETAGVMDYREYARRFWSELTGEETDEKNDRFQSFEKKLVAGLHAIPMRDLVYEHVLASMPELVEKYKDSIEHLALWSKGDVDTTGYQVKKIESSRIVQKFMREVAQQGSGLGQSARDFLAGKTSYEVAGDKLENVVECVKKKILSGSQNVRVVLIEDTFDNFVKVRESLRHALGDAGMQRVDIVNVWALYSREGIRAKREAAQGAVARENFEEKLSTTIPIESFRDLLEPGRFARVFDHASVFVDFDGVIADNLRMRDIQASVILAAAVDTLSQARRVGRGTAREEILKRLAPKE